MIHINPKDNKELKFEVEIENINPKDLIGHMRFVIDEIEYGIPVHISSNQISVDIPPLNEIVNKNLKNGEIIKAKLDIHGEGFFISPWSSDFKIVSPISIEAKLINEKSIPQVKVKENNKEKNIKIIEEKESKKKEKNTNYVVTENTIELALNKLNINNPMIREKVLTVAKLKAAQNYGEVSPRNILKEILKNYGKKK